MMTTPTIAQEFASFASSGPAVPSAVRERMQLHVLDTLGVCLAASTSAGIRRMVAAARLHGGTPISTVIGHELVVPPSRAAMLNGTFAHAEDFDDVHPGAVAHPGSIIVPALLALGEQRRCSGTEFLDAMCIGTETNIRLGLAVGADFVRRGIPAFSPLGTLAAALAAATLLRSDPSVCANAMGLAGSTAGGSHEWLESGGTAKSTTSGWAASCAVLAAQLAARGFSAPLAIVEGRKGLVRAFAGERVEAIRDHLGELGSRWECSGMRLKAYPACQGAQAYIDCTLEILRAGVRAADIAQIEVRAGSVIGRTLCEPTEVKRRPPTAYAAKFSIPFLVAMALARSTVDRGHFTEVLVDDPDIRALVDRMSIEIDERLDQGTAVRGYVRVVTSDGREHVSEVTAATGSPGNQMNARQVVDKFTRNAAAVIGQAAVDRTVEACLNLTEIGDITELIHWLQPRM